MHLSALKACKMLPVLIDELLIDIFYLDKSSKRLEAVKHFQNLCGTYVGRRKYGVLSVVVRGIWSLISGCSWNMESYQWLFVKYSLISGCSWNMESYQWLFMKF